MSGQSLHPSDSPGLLLWRVTLRWQRRITTVLKPLGLTHVQFVLLTSTWWLTTHASESPSQTRLAEHAGTDPMMTSQVVRGLVERGLLRREVDPSDARIRRLDVTAEGAELAVRAVAIVEAADREFFAPAKDQAAMLAILGRLDG